MVYSLAESATSMNLGSAGILVIIAIILILSGSSGGRDR